MSVDGLNSVRYSKWHIIMGNRFYGAVAFTMSTEQNPTKLKNQRKYLPSLEEEVNNGARMNRCTSVEIL